MSITLSGSTVTFNDGSTQTTTGAPQAVDAIGSTILAFYAPASAVDYNDNVAGSNLRYRPTSSYPYNTTNIYSASYASGYSSVQTGFAGLGPHSVFSFNQQSGGSAVWRDTAAAYLAGGGTALSGTWKKVSSGPSYYSYPYSYGTGYFWYIGLYRRLS